MEMGKTFNSVVKWASVCPFKSSSLLLSTDIYLSAPFIQTHLTFKGVGL